MKIVYPIRITEKDGTGYRMVYLPDFDGYTQGRDLYECIEMAADYITNFIISGNELPEPTPIGSLEKNDEYVCDTLIPIDTVSILDSHSKTVRKNVTLPEWLNNKAERRGINFSQTLKDALINKLE